MLQLASRLNLKYAQVYILAILPHFCFHWGRPWGNNAKSCMDAWKENSMLTNCLAACAHLTITFSETERYICEKNRHYIIPPCIRRPRYGASRQNIATPFGMEKLEWWGYPTVEKL